MNYSSFQWRLRSAVKTQLRWAFASYRWLANSLDTQRDKSVRLWEDRLPTEIRFWDTWIANRGGIYADDFRRCTDPNLELQPDIARFVTSGDVRLLDVGAGPLTVLGKVWNKQKLNITAVDPLADEYSRLLERYGVSPIVRTQQCCAERLLDMFAPNSFDISHASNCLDHSYSPLEAIEQMLAVTRTGGAVILKHEINEGSNELYRGLHQWNFAQKNGEFVISAPARASVNVSRMLASRADIFLSERSDINYLDVVLIKK